MGKVLAPITAYSTKPFQSGMLYFSLLCEDEFVDLLTMLLGLMYHLEKDMKMREKVLLVVLCHKSKLTCVSSLNGVNHDSIEGLPRLKCYKGAR